MHSIAFSALSFRTPPRLLSTIRCWCRFDGELPQSWGRLERLKVLRLNENRFKGTLPLDWSELLSLTELDVTSNALTGPIPKAVLNLLQPDARMLRKRAKALAHEPGGAGGGAGGDAGAAITCVSKLKIVRLRGNDWADLVPRWPEGMLDAPQRHHRPEPRRPARH